MGAWKGGGVAACGARQGGGARHQGVHRITYNAVAAALVTAARGLAASCSIRRTEHGVEWQTVHRLCLASKSVWAVIVPVELRCRSTDTLRSARPLIDDVSLSALPVMHSCPHNRPCCDSHPR